jgi:hypothetical protein
LWVEETSQPYARRHVEVGDPVFKILDPEKEISIPGRQPTHGGISSLGPRVGYSAEVEGILEVFHVCCNGEFPLHVKVQSGWKKHNGEQGKQANAFIMALLMYTPHGVY